MKVFSAVALHWLLDQLTIAPSLDLSRVSLPVISVLLVIVLLIIDVLLSSECTNYSLSNDIMDRPHTIFKNSVRILWYIFYILQEIASF
jgi:hypothetical protein